MREANSMGYDEHGPQRPLSKGRHPDSAKLDTRGSLDQVQIRTIRQVNGSRVGMMKKSQHHDPTGPCSQTELLLPQGTYRFLRRRVCFL